MDLEAQRFLSQQHVRLYSAGREVIPSVQTHGTTNGIAKLKLRSGNTANYVNLYLFLQDG
jgi:hypothetical protein